MCMGIMSNVLLFAASGMVSRPVSWRELEMCCRTESFEKRVFWFVAEEFFSVDFGSTCGETYVGKMTGSGSRRGLGHRVERASVLLSAKCSLPIYFQVQE
jgi:hypothetical protein